MAVDEHEPLTVEFLCDHCGMPTEGPQQWQAIETAPKDATWLLLWDGNCRVIGRFCAGDTRWEDADATAFMATHWMPLPDPPVLSR